MRKLILEVVSVSALVYSLTLIPAVNAQTGNEDYYITVSPFLQKIPLAVPHFKIGSGSTVKADTARAAADLLANSLEFTGYFKLLDREVVDAYLDLNERHLFFRGLVSWLGFRQVDLPFEVQPRAGGQTKWSVLKLTLMAINSIMSFSAMPLRLPPTRLSRHWRKRSRRMTSWCRRG